MQNGVKMSLKGKTSGNGQMDRILIILKNKLIRGVSLTLSWGYLHVYEHYSQTNLLVNISGLR